MIVVHHLDNSRSQRVLWLLEELGVPYEVKRYQRDPKTMLAPSELKAVHPLGKSPVVVDGDVRVAESGAILEYLVDTYGDRSLRPVAGTTAARRYRYWMHYAEGSAMPPLLMALIFNRVERGPMPFFAKPVAKRIVSRVRSTFIEPNLRTHLDFIESELAQRPWFAGDAFTAADVQMSFPMEAFAGRAGLDASRPAAWAWLQKIHERPAYRRAIEVGGPLRLG